MNDLEICKCIADIEKIYYIETKYSDGVNFLGLVNEPDGCCTPPELIGEYNPLTDNALCFHLMIKHRIDFNHAILTDNTLHRYQAVNTITGKGWGLDKNPNKAICLAIIKANKGLHYEYQRLSKCRVNG